MSLLKFSRAWSNINQLSTNSIMQVSDSGLLLTHIQEYCHSNFMLTNCQFHLILHINLFKTHFVNCFLRARRSRSYFPCMSIHSCLSSFVHNQINALCHLTSLAEVIMNKTNIYTTNKQAVATGIPV